MKRVFNYTQRIRIRQSDVHFFLKEAGDDWIFNGMLNLDPYKLPPDARIFVEAYRQTTRRRFCWGTVSAPLKPPERLRLLSEFDSPEGIRIRVKITSSGAAGSPPRGQLLAVADRIPLRRDGEEDAGRIPLLPVKPDDLDDLLWQVDFSNEPPLLLINKEAGDYRQLCSNPAFVALVYPAVLREILTHILLEDHRDPADEDDPYHFWLRFITEELKMDAPPKKDGDDSERDREWIDDVVAAFAKKFNFLDKFKQFWHQEERE